MTVIDLIEKLQTRVREQPDIGSSLVYVSSDVKSKEVLKYIYYNKDKTLELAGRPLPFNKIDRLETIKL